MATKKKIASTGKKISRTAAKTKGNESKKRDLAIKGAKKKLGKKVKKAAPPTRGFNENLIITKTTVFDIKPVPFDEDLPPEIFEEELPPGKYVPLGLDNVPPPAITPVKLLSIDDKLNILRNLDLMSPTEPVWSKNSNSLFL